MELGSDRRARLARSRGSEGRAPRDGHPRPDPTGRRRKARAPSGLNLSR
jgi:hypothetical protein